MYITCFPNGEDAFSLRSIQYADSPCLQILVLSFISPVLNGGTFYHNPSKDQQPTGVLKKTKEKKNNKNKNNTKDLCLHFLKCYSPLFESISEQ